MRRQARVVQVTAALATMACVLAASAASASAITIEPLNTKFSGHPREVIWTTGGNKHWACPAGLATFKGTTNSTKTSYVNLTPTFEGCETEAIGSKWKLEYANSCKEKGMVPWTLTLTEGSGPYTGTTKFNCSFTLTSGTCTATVSPQTITKGLSWTSWPTLSRVTLTLEKIKYKITTESISCGFVGFQKEGENLSLEVKEVELAGIKAS